MRFPRDPRRPWYSVYTADEAPDNSCYFDPETGQMFETTQPANTPGWYTVWEKYIDKSGKTIIIGHRTCNPRNVFEHWHEKEPFKGLELKNEADYLKRVEQILRVYKMI